jgi:putative ABC transport system permease protein
MFVNALRMAIQALLRHRLRTTLTALGISIGIASVMSTVALGAGSTAAVEAQLDAVGESFVWVIPGSATVGGVRSGAGGRRSLKLEDAQAIPGQVPGIAVCSPVVNGRDQLVYGNHNWNTRLVGVSPEYFRIRRWATTQGTTFGTYEMQSHSKVLILGTNVAEELFDTADPIGKTVRLGRFPFTVIGVLRPRGSDRGGVNQDDAVVLPFTTAQNSIEGKTWIDEIMCSTTSPDLTPVAEAGVTGLLRMRHNIGPDDPDDFQLRRPQEFLTLRLNSLNSLGLMLSSVALVSLVVGGIGIMNIMLVSVAERTHEIGLRLAIGARERDIRLQFLTEALMLGLVGAVIGISMGLVASQLLASSFGWRTIISPQSILAAVAFAVTAGLVFGYVPAQRASALDPIEALRRE